MNVELPDGTTLTDIPEGTTRAQLRAKLEANGYDVSKLPAEPAVGQAKAAALPASRGATAGQGRADEEAGILERHPLTRSLRAYGKFAGDAIVGLGKGTQDLVNASGLNKSLAPEGSPLAVTPTDDPADRTATLDQMYKEAGPGALVGKLTAEGAATGGPAGKAAGVAMDAVKGSGKLAGALRYLAGAATGGGVGGALVAPRDGETRGGNALQGAATSLVFAPAFALAGKGLQLGRDFVTGGSADAIKGKAGRFFEKTLGADRLKNVDQQLQNPAEIPMSTAALSGDDALASLERVSRRRSTPLENESWNQLDSRTNRAVGEKVNAAVGDDIANLQPRAEEVKATLQEAQNALNRIPLKDGPKQELADELMSLKNRPEFENNTKAQRYLNDFVGNFMDPGAKRTVGGLAHFETDLAQDASLSPKAREAIWGVIRKHIDANGGGAWSEAYNIRSELQKQLGESQAANAVLGDFNSAFGRGKGKLTPEGEPLYAADQLRKSIIKRGETVGETPQDLLNPRTRQALNDVEDQARVSSLPARGKGGENLPESPWGSVVLGPGGLPIGDYKTRMIAEMLRKAARAVGADRSEAIRAASNKALQDPVEFRAVLDSLEKSKKVSASDAAMLARILRGSAAASGNTANDY